MALLLSACVLLAPCPGPRLSLPTNLSAACKRGAWVNMALDYLERAATNPLVDDKFRAADSLPSRRDAG